MTTMRDQARASMILLGALSLAACAVRAGGIETTVGPTRGAQTREEAQRIIASARPTERHVLSADREVLWRAADEWLGARFKKLSHRDEKLGQLETHQVVFQGDGPLPVSTRVSVRLIPHQNLPEAITLEVLALELTPELEPLATGGGAQYDWRLVGNAPDVERAIADQILERYSLLREGLTPDLPRPIGS